MTAKNASQGHLPRTVQASLDARLGPFQVNDRGAALEDLDVEPAQAVTPLQERLQDRKLRLRLANDLKLLFAALGAGGTAIPMGDNGRTTRLLASYAASLQDR